MAKKKEPPNKTGQHVGPKAGRPYIPGYGVPSHNNGLLDWSHVTQLMQEARHYWVCTLSPDGQPHATPVDGLWVDDKLYFGGRPQTRRHRNLLANPAVCIHLESATEVVILQGKAGQLMSPDETLAARLQEASVKKYGYGPKADELGSGGVWVFKPRKVLAWKRFPQDATRWQIQVD